VEGLASGSALHKLQQAFVDHDGPQCGFCTSGQLMSACALLEKNPHPTTEQARAAMTGNICRCANYNRYVEAVVAAGAPRATTGTARPVTATIPALNTVGHATPRIDAAERVTGRAKYTGDVQLPGMLFGRILRSPHPHARIRRIDTSKALALPGVKAVLTHENGAVVWGSGSVAGGQQYNDEVKKITRHQRYTFNNPVRFVGDPVAAVAAVDRHVAEEALRLIEVEYEPLPFVLDPEEALKPGAPQIWPEGNLSPTGRNEQQPIATRRGSIEQGLQSSIRRPEALPTAAPIWRAISASRLKKSA
jgi:putative selenate reductase molybdopterin-binding subunit